MSEFDVDYVVNLIVQRCDCLDEDQLREIEVRLSGGAGEVNVATLDRIVAAIDALEDRLTATIERTRVEREAAQIAQEFIESASADVQWQ